MKNRFKVLMVSKFDGEITDDATGKKQKHKSYKIFCEGRHLSQDDDFVNEEMISSKRGLSLDEFKTNSKVWQTLQDCLFPVQVEAEVIFKKSQVFIDDVTIVETIGQKKVS